MNNKYLPTFLLLCIGVTPLVSFSTNVFASGEHDEVHSKKHDDKHGDEHKDEHSDEHDDEHKDEHGDGHHDEHGDEEGHVKITPTLAKKVGITTVAAHSGSINNTVTAYGKVVLGAEGKGKIQARFPGIITKLTLNIGDVVKQGDVIAEIESSKSLNTYKILAPISGVISKRYANQGELANNQVLLTISNYQQLWLELQIYPSQLQDVSVGDNVTISHNNTQTSSRIKHLLPSNENQPFIIARVPLKNTNQQWSPGLLVTGSVVVKQTQVPLLIDNRALQTIEDELIVFVKNDLGFETRQLTLGQTDGISTQVLSGLQLGEQYAVENSYLLKADLGKSSAAHVH